MKNLPEAIQHKQDNVPSNNLIKTISKDNGGIYAFRRKWSGLKSILPQQNTTAQKSRSPKPDTKKYHIQNSNIIFSISISIPISISAYLFLFPISYHIQFNNDLQDPTQLNPFFSLIHIYIYINNLVSKKKADLFSSIPTFPALTFLISSNSIPYFWRALCFLSLPYLFPMRKRNSYLLQAKKKKKAISRKIRERELTTGYLKFVFLRYHLPPPDHYRSYDRMVIGNTIVAPPLSNLPLQLRSGAKPTLTAYFRKIR